ncbi:hypothetical protein CY34DRAFT_219423 [Suillus luteus UH-Slu-Lm8-n1]|uniref:Uncharacterized protein n=1 Tax=Suillus luteus UH-Slu-Lm8-n1 TaxID=930992 RepID=A0A0D0AHD7_9AGAM|nr:hypothetical protein CY34DRAFT_219423 [Suillus luteus UH-Slu-Lm8-n1]
MSTWLSNGRRLSSRPRCGCLKAPWKGLVAIFLSSLPWSVVFTRSVLISLHRIVLQHIRNQKFHKILATINLLFVTTGVTAPQQMGTRSMNTGRR